MNITTKTKDNYIYANISVRELVSLVFKRGSITRSQVGIEYSVGTAIHSMVEKNHKALNETYQKEVRLSTDSEYRDLRIHIQGRADGIFYDGENYVIEEIKSINYPLGLINDDFTYAHLCQAKLYAAMLLNKKEMKRCGVRLTYVHIDTGEIINRDYCYSSEELRAFYNDTVCSIYRFIGFEKNHKSQRDEYLATMKFPFKSSRTGQKEIVGEVYSAIKNGVNLFANAPTGIGKTVSTLFPALKALGKGHCSKVFYLTAKNSVQTLAANTVSSLSRGSNKISCITITAKGKICPLGDKCTPEKCICANGHYDRINDAIFDIISNEALITRETIQKYAEKHSVCPFEFSLDVSEFCDIIICDYNYIYDPHAGLKRYADSSEKFAILVDEAHNLPDRAREMYSAFIDKEDCLIFSKLLSKYKSLQKGFYNLYEDIKTFEKSTRDENRLVFQNPPDEILRSAQQLYSSLQFFLKDENEKIKELVGASFDRLTEFYFELNHLLKVSENYNSRYYKTYFGEDGLLNLFCIEPGEEIKKAENKSSAVYFSGTLLPSEYFCSILGRTERDIVLDIPSPFPEDNLLLLNSPISTRYSERANTAFSVAKAIRAVSYPKKGNYFVFFPSFAYLKTVQEIYSSKYDDEIVVQKSNMSQRARNEFLKLFDTATDKTRLFFAVMGGIFSEGIDLAGDKLIGAVIVGVGLPTLCARQETISAHYNEKEEFGHGYSYIYPGLNKVFQAAGRVIRSATDRGVVLLIDDRYTNPEYSELFPGHWSHIKVQSTPKEIYETSKSFWAGQ